MTNRTPGELADAVLCVIQCLRPRWKTEIKDLEDAATALREMEGTRIEGCEVIGSRWNNYGALELNLRLPQGPGPVAQEFLGMSVTLILEHLPTGDPREKDDEASH